MVNDEQLNHAIKDAISADANLVKYIDKVHVKVDGGVVTLSGVVSSSDIKSNLEAKAKAVMGVKKVVDNIEVMKTEVK